MRILVVDDDAELRRLVAFTLRGDGHEVVEADSGEAALALFAAAGPHDRPELIVLDVNMPGLDGFEVLRRVRANSAVPVVMLTVRAGEGDQVRGLDLGADDYLAKPFSPRTLSARVRALARRAGTARPGPLVCGDLELDPDEQLVRVGGGEPVRLTALEFRLLSLLAATPGRTVPTEKIARHVWGYQGIGDRTRLKQLVHRLRHKIEADPADAQRLVTIAGLGYALNPR